MKTRIAKGLQSWVWAAILIGAGCQGAVQKTATPAKDPPKLPDEKSGQAANATDQGQDDLSGFDQGEESGGSGEADALTQILDECGLGEDGMDNPERKVADQTLKATITEKGQKSVPLMGDIQYTVFVGATVDIESTLEGSVKKKTIQVDRVQASSFESKVRDKAEERIAGKSGTTRDSYVPADERPNLGSEYPAWDGIFCSVGAVREMSNTKGANQMAVEFPEMPLPASVSPLAAQKRLDAEIGNGLQFDGIKAVVKSSTFENITAGAELQGSVSVQPIQPQFSAGQTNVTGDRAYQVQTMFRDKKTTDAMGLNPNVRMFFQGQKISALVVEDVDNPDRGPIIFKAR